MFWEISQNSQENTCARVSFLHKVRRCRFATSLKTRLQNKFFFEICKKTFFAEHHRTTASDYSSINTSEGGIGKQNCKLWYRNWNKPIWARSVSYQKGQSRQKNKFNSCFRRRSPEQNPVRLSAVDTKVNCKKLIAAAKITTLPLYHFTTLPQVGNSWMVFLLLNLLVS